LILISYSTYLYPEFNYGGIGGDGMMFNSIYSELFLGFFY